MKPRFFATPEKFRAWLAKHHQRAPELLVGFHKKATGKASIDWPQSVDEALCFGWIDGVRRAWVMKATRFVSRRAARAASGARSISGGSPSSSGRAHAARGAGRIRAALARSIRDLCIRTARRREARRGGDRALFKAQPEAWQYFSNLAPSYRHKAIYWITSARKPETRHTRLARIIAMATRKEKR